MYTVVSVKKKTDFLKFTQILRCDTLNMFGFVGYIQLQVDQPTLISTAWNKAHTVGLFYC